MELPAAEETSSEKTNQLSLWLRAAGLVALTIVALPIAVRLASGSGSDERIPNDDVFRQQLGIALTKEDATCVTNAGYGDDYLIGALSCLSGEPRRFLLDVTMRKSFSQFGGATPQSVVDCFVTWGFQSRATDRLRQIGQAGLPVADASEAARLYIVNDGAKPCLDA